jgi:hypothetical protein
MSHSDKKIAREYIPGHKGMIEDDLPVESDSEYSDSVESDAENDSESFDGQICDEDDGSPFEVCAVEIIDKLDTISNALVTDDGTGVADVLASIAESLHAIAKLMYAQRKK